MENQKKAYIHINNGGISFKITPETLDLKYVSESLQFAQLEISANHFGIQTNSMQIPMTSKMLLDLSNFFLEQSKLISTNCKPADLCVDDIDILLLK
jgi:hypothetical protein